MGTSNEYGNLRRAILEGDQDQAAAIGEDMAAHADNILEAVEVASGVIREVGDKFGAGELFLPEMVLAAEAMQGFMDEVTPRLEAEAGSAQATGKDGDGHQPYAPTHHGSATRLGGLRSSRNTPSPSVAAYRVRPSVDRARACTARVRSPWLIFTHLSPPLANR